MNYKVKIKTGKTYRVRGHRHFASNGLDVYSVDNPFLGMASSFRNERIGKLETGDYCKVIQFSCNYTQIKVQGEIVWVHSHTFSCSVKPLTTKISKI